MPQEVTEELVNNTEIQAGDRYSEVIADASVEVSGGDDDHDLRIE